MFFFDECLVKKNRKKVLFFIDFTSFFLLISVQNCGT